MLRRLAPPHLLLAGYCAGLCLALGVRPPAWVLVAAAAVIAGALAFQLWRVSRDGAGPGWLLAAPAPPGRALRSSAAWPSGPGVSRRSPRASCVRGSGARSTVSAVLTDLPAVKEQAATLAVDVAGRRRTSGVGARPPPAAARRRSDAPGGVERPARRGCPRGWSAACAWRTSRRPAPAPSTTGGTSGVAASTSPWRATSRGCASPGRRGGLQGTVDRAARRLSRAPADGAARHRRRGPPGDGARRRRGRRSGGDRRLPAQRPAAHHGGLGRERRAALQHVGLRVRPPGRPQARAYGSAAPARARLRPAHRGVSFHRPRRRLRRRRAARRDGVAVHRRLAPVAPAGCLAPHRQSQQPLRRQLPAVVRRRGGAPRAGAGRSRASSPGFPGHCPPRPASPRPPASPRRRSRCSPSGRRHSSVCRPTSWVGSCSGPSCSSGCCRCCSASWRPGRRPRSTSSPACSSASCSRWPTGSPRCPGPSSSGGGGRCGSCSSRRWPVRARCCGSWRRAPAKGCARS